MLQSAGLHVGDFIVAVGGNDVKWASHDHVVDIIRRCDATVQLSLVTPIDRNYIQSSMTSSVSSSATVNSVAVTSSSEITTCRPLLPLNDKKAGSSSWLLGRRRGEAFHKKKTKSSWKLPCLLISSHSITRGDVTLPCHVRFHRKYRYNCYYFEQVYAVVDYDCSTLFSYFLKLFAPPLPVRHSWFHQRKASLHRVCSCVSACLLIPYLSVRWVGLFHRMPTFAPSFVHISDGDALWSSSLSAFFVRLPLLCRVINCFNTRM